MKTILSETGNSETNQSEKPARHVIFAESSEVRLFFKPQLVVEKVEDYVAKQMVRPHPAEEKPPFNIRELESPPASHPGRQLHRHSFKRSAEGPLSKEKPKFQHTDEQPMVPAPSNGVDDEADPKAMANLLLSLGVFPQPAAVLTVSLAADSKPLHNDT